MDRPGGELSPETQRRVDAIMAQARVEAEANRPEKRLAIALGALTGIVSLIAVTMVWVQQPSFRSPYLFLVSVLPFLTFMVSRQGSTQEPRGVFRIDLLSVWLTIEAAIGVVFSIAVVLIVSSMLIEWASPRVADLFFDVALVGGSCSIAALFVFFFALAWRVRVVVDDNQLRECRLLRTVGAQWFEIQSIEVEPAADRLALVFLWPASALYRAIIGRLRRRGLLQDEGWSVRRVRLHDGRSFALRVPDLMEPAVHERMTEEILRRAREGSVPVVDRSGVPLQPDVLEPSKL